MFTGMASMSSPCKHPIPSLEVEGYDWIDRHPYGEDRHTDYRLVCTGCKKHVEIGRSHSIFLSDYLKLTGRTVDVFEEAKSLFKENNDIFHRIVGLHEGIKKMVMANPKLEKKIVAKQKQIEKLKKELFVLKTQYNGGKEPFLP